MTSASGVYPIIVYLAVCHPLFPARNEEPCLIFLEKLSLQHSVRESGCVALH
jgi:hypothetical protein